MLVKELGATYTFTLHFLEITQRHPLTLSPSQVRQNNSTPSQVKQNNSTPSQVNYSHLSPSQVRQDNLTPSHKPLLINSLGLT